MASCTHGRRYIFTEDFRETMEGSLYDNAKNFRHTGLLTRKAYMTELVSQHPGLASKSQ